MPRKVTPPTSRGAKPDEQPPRYGLRKRTAHRMVSDDNIVEDAGHQTFVKETKRTPLNTRAQSSSSRGIVKRKTKVSSVQGRAKENKNKLWLAEAIREETNTQYLIEYKPVSEGAQCETLWQPKRNANAALVNDWEEREMATAHGNSNTELDNDAALTKKEDGTRRRRSLMAYGGQLRKSSADLRLLGQYNTESEDLQQDSADPVDKRTSGGFEKTPRNTLLIATSPIIPGILDNLVPERNVPVARMYESVASNGRRAASARLVTQPDSYGQAEGTRKFPEGHVANSGGHGRPSPRSGTSISTILSQPPYTLSNINRDKESATSRGKDSGQASPRTFARVEASKNRDPGVSGAVSGKLASAREQLRVLLLGPGRRRFRKSFPPSP